MAIVIVDRPGDADGILAIDVSNLVYRSYFAYDLKTSDGRPTGHIYGPVRLLLSALNDLKEGKWCVALAYDGKKAKAERQKVLPTYKANRDEDRKPKGLFEEATDVLKHVPGIHILNELYEADDAIAFMAQKFTKHVVILSGDKDFWPLIKMPHVKVMSPNLGRYVLESDVLDKFYVTDPNKIYLAKSLFGDASDGIKGVERLTKKHVLETLNDPNVTNVTDFYKNLNNVPIKTLEKLQKFESQVHSNYEVILPRTSGFTKNDIRLIDSSVEECQSMKEKLKSWECFNLIDIVDQLFGI